MKPYYMELYLLAINLVAFLMITVECLGYQKRRRMFPLPLFIVLMFAGGSLGSWLAYSIFGQRPQGHDNTVTRDDFLNRKIPSLLFMIIYLIIYVFYIREISIIAHLPISLQNGFTSRTVLLVLIIYVSAVNILGFAMFGIDKRKAVKNRTRISIRTLFTVSAIGGAVGTLLGMKVFHHKTNKLYFRLGIPLIIIIHVLLIIRILFSLYL